MNPFTPLRSRRRPLLALLVLTSCAHAQGVTPETPPPAPTQAVVQNGPLSPNNANPRLTKHSHFFGAEPAKPWSEPTILPTIYKLKEQHWPLDKYPSQVTYEPYSAVGYDLANTIVLVGNKLTKEGFPEWIIVDTLGSTKTVDEVIPALRKRIYGREKAGPEKLPIRAIIYTHNHIDHTGGVNGYLAAAKLPPCAPETAQNAGKDGYFNADTVNADTADCVAVIGQENINSAIVNTSTVVGSIIDARSYYMYGNAVPEARINSGIGPREVSGENPKKGAYYQLPSKTFSQSLNLTAAGINLNLRYVPSETDDEIIAFVPDRYNLPESKVTGSEDWSKESGLLLAAEVIQGPSFPNLYSLRGTGFRDPSTWYTSVDVLRSLDSWCMVPSHGPPLCERDNIELLLRSFRDAIQFTNDQAIRYINRGYTLVELPQLIQLPQYLVEDLDQLKPIQNEGPLHTGTPVGMGWVNPRDYLTEFYGSVSQGVREIYVGKVGFFQADPIELRPTPPQESARRLVQLMQSPNTNVLQVAKAAQDAALKLNKTDPEYIKGLQWAAELATLVIQAGVTDPTYPTHIGATTTCKQSATPEVQQARQIKSTSFAYMAEPEINPNWRNWYAASSRELDCLLPLHEVNGGLVSSTIISALPGSHWVQSLGLRLIPGETNQSLGFIIRNELGVPSPGTAGYTLTIRKAVAQFAQGSTEDTLKAATTVLDMDRSALDALIEADGTNTLITTLQDQVAQKKIRAIKGNSDSAVTFLQNFDPKPIAIPVLSGR
ncbi:lactamase [Cystobacter fuscus]|uniref:Lactamase n=1 Tax=Cystobacter fuscus TaxID=43 RepID=A0A250IZB2_9BACT|nr:alkyl sulfatase dimerization domain-containing protein [Cystobacter fuscus]ATB36246.1 lactamase [Cystobacter fuscus]